MALARAVAKIVLDTPWSRKKNFSTILIVFLVARFITASLMDTLPWRKLWATLVLLLPRW